MFDYIHILWDAVFLTKHPCFGEKAMGLSLASVKCYVSARGRTLSPTKMLCLCHRRRCSIFDIIFTKLCRLVSL